MARLFENWIIGSIIGLTRELRVCVFILRRKKSRPGFATVGFEVDRLIRVSPCRAPFFVFWPISTFLTIELTIKVSDVSSSAIGEGESAGDENQHRGWNMLPARKFRDTLGTKESSWTPRRDWALHSDLTPRDIGYNFVMPPDGLYGASWIEKRARLH
ncbi:hypothetical protein RRF57_007962 [Xylaria bambusicola]|uniref:Uncharacterized protein n=1 Tax=Xylaria bambusicola TaxID=326684 RepID=A0AAN7ULX8_9PEZI